MMLILISSVLQFCHDFYEFFFVCFNPLPSSLSFSHSKKKKKYTGVLAPTLVQFEQEIDQEIEKDQQQQQQQNMGHSQIPYMIQQKHPSGYNIGCNIDDDDTISSQPQQQIINNDLESLHEKVIFSSWKIFREKK